MKKTHHIPEGYRTVTPYLTVSGARELLEFIEKAFDATRLECMDAPDGTVMHAAIRIGDSPVMIGEGCKERGPMPGCIFLYVEDADAVYRKALEAGATSMMEPADMFWGDRMSGVKDKWGNIWWPSTHIEDVPKDEVKKRAQACMEQQESA